MFFDENYTKEGSSGEIKDPGHYVFDFTKGVNHLVPVIIGVIIVLFQKQIITYSTKLLEKLGFL